VGKRYLKKIATGVAKVLGLSCLANHFRHGNAFKEVVSPNHAMTKKPISKKASV
jgi:hypothetical protein